SCLPHFVPLLPLELFPYFQSHKHPHRSCYFPSFQQFHPYYYYFFHHLLHRINPDNLIRRNKSLQPNLTSSPCSPSFSKAHTPGFSFKFFMIHLINVLPYDSSFSLSSTKSFNFCEKPLYFSGVVSFAKEPVPFCRSTVPSSNCTYRLQAYPSS